MIPIIKKDYEWQQLHQDTGGYYFYDNLGKYYLGWLDYDKKMENRIQDIRIVDLALL
jgi:hypothetical protein